MFSFFSSAATLYNWHFFLCVFLYVHVQETTQSKQIDQTQLNQIKSKPAKPKLTNQTKYIVLCSTCTDPYLFELQGGSVSVWNWGESLLPWQGLLPRARGAAGETRGGGDSSFCPRHLGRQLRGLLHKVHKVFKNGELFIYIGNIRWSKYLQKSTCCAAPDLAHNLDHQVFSGT